MKKSILKTIYFIRYSPEAIASETFSFDSDVWSFGVTLFEMFSRGKPPNLVPDVEIQPWDLLEKLTKGERLKKPELCEEIIYHDLILPCWNAIPKCRPNFDQIITKIIMLMDNPLFNKSTECTN